MKKLLKNILPVGAIVTICVVPLMSAEILQKPPVDFEYNSTTKIITFNDKTFKIAEILGDKVYIKSLLGNDIPISTDKTTFNKDWLTFYLINNQICIFSSETNQFVNLNTNFILQQVTKPPKVWHITNNIDYITYYYNNNYYYLSNIEGTYWWWITSDFESIRLIDDKLIEFKLIDNNYMLINLQFHQRTLSTSIPTVSLNVSNNVLLKIINNNKVQFYDINLNLNANFSETQLNGTKFIEWKSGNNIVLHNEFGILLTKDFDKAEKDFNLAKSTYENSKTSAEEQTNFLSLVKCKIVLEKSFIKLPSSEQLKKTQTLDSLINDFNTIKKTFNIKKVLTSNQDQNTIFIATQKFDNLKSIFDQKYTAFNNATSSFDKQRAFEDLEVAFEDLQTYFDSVTNEIQSIKQTLMVNVKNLYKTAYATTTYNQEYDRLKGLYETSKTTYNEKTTLVGKQTAIIPLTTAFTALENHYNSSTTLKTAKLSDFTSLKQTHEALKNTLSTEEQATTTYNQEYDRLKGLYETSKNNFSW